MVSWTSLFGFSSADGLASVLGGSTVSWGISLSSSESDSRWCGVPGRRVDTGIRVKSVGSGVGVGRVGSAGLGTCRFGSGSGSNAGAGVDGLSAGGLGSSAFDGAANIGGVDDTLENVIWYITGTWTTLKMWPGTKTELSELLRVDWIGAW